VDQELNTVQLSALIGNPNQVTGDDLSSLKRYAEKYPYFQPLHLLLAKANLQNSNADTDLASAALYTSGQLMHQVLHQNSLPDTAFNIVSYSAHARLENEPEALDETGIDEVSADSEEAQIRDEQEIFEEITEFNIEDYRQNHQTETQERSESPEDELVLENIVSTDFFAFQDNFNVENLPEETTDIEKYSEPAEAGQQDHIISKYDDDRLPYTFLWWLAKTRKEHEQIFQPYASPKKVKGTEKENSGLSNIPRELQQQYVENIFHMQSAFDEHDSAATVLRRNSKGDEIIESFIKNEPQISPPKPEQINVENKAKKSAEDHSDLVSETLAKIYIEQMLYDKAIETYEKLSLMFPEKSRYFADLIQSIEKKI